MMDKLWAGMLPSEPVKVWRPDGTMFFHDTYTEVASHIAATIDVFLWAEIGEMAVVLLVDGAIMTHEGEWTIAR